MTSKAAKISSGILILLLVCFLSRGVFFGNQTVQFRGSTYEFRDDEYGLMLFNDYNCGDFHVNSILSDDSVILMQLYDYQKKINFWVKYQHDELYLIDSLNYDIDRFNKVEFENIN